MTGADAYGEAFADSYDALYEGRGDVADAVALLGRLAGSARGSALELGVGTGRIAIPLRERIGRLVGLDASARMLEVLATKDPKERVERRLGSMVDGVPGERFDLVYCPFNSLFLVPSQDEQVAVFRAAAAALRPDGRFCIECFVPDPAATAAQPVRVKVAAAGRVVIHTATVYPSAQVVRSTDVVLDGTGTRLLPVTVRYAWPSELDLMAALAGLRLVERYGSWAEDPFTASSRGHVSVYAPTAGG